MEYIVSIGAAIATAIIIAHRRKKRLESQERVKRMIEKSRQEAQKEYRATWEKLSGRKYPEEEIRFFR